MVTGQGSFSKSATIHIAIRLSAMAPNRKRIILNA